LVEVSNAVVHIVAYSITVCIGHAVPTADTKYVEHIALAVAGPKWHCVASAFEDASRPIAHAAFVKSSYAAIHIVTFTIAVEVG
jgi:hypothetical protein